MRLESIVLQNFGPYADVELDLRQVSAATVSGPNGSGKSTLVSDGVLWCLFGQCRAETDAFIKLGETDMFATVIFAANGQRFRATRTRSIRTKRGKSDWQLTMQSGSEWTPVERGIEKILNADFDVVTASNFITQDDPFDLCKAKPARRIGLLSDILDIAKYTEDAKTATRHGNLAEGQLTSLVGQLDEKRQAVERHLQAVNELKAVEQELVGVSADLTKTQAEIERHVKQIASLEATIQAMPEEDISYLETQVSVLEHTRDRLTAKIEELEALAGREEALLGKQAALGVLNTSHAQHVEKRQGCQEDVTKADEAIQQAQRQIDGLSLESAALQRQRAGLEADLANVRNRIAEYEQVVASGGSRAEIAKQLHEAEQQKKEKDREFDEATQGATYAQATHTERYRIYQDAKRAMELAVTRQTDAIRQAERWAEQYAQETASLETAIVKAEEPAKILTIVPCDEGLQRRCQFVSAALQSKETVPVLQAKLAERETDPQKILTLAPVDIKTPGDDVRRLVLADDEAMSAYKEAEKACHAAQQRVGALRLEVKTLDEECTALRRSLPDAAYLQKAHAELPGLRVDLTEKEQTCVALSIHIKALDAEIARTDLSAKQSARAMAAGGLQLVDGELHELERQRAAIQAELADLPKVLHAKEALPGVRQDLETKVNDLTKVQQSLDHAKTHATRKADLQRQLAEATDQHEGAKTFLGRLQALHRTCLERQSQAKAVIAQTCEAAAALQAIEKQVTELKASVQHYSWLAEAYRRVPVLMIDNAIPVVEREANLALQQLSAKGMTLRFETQKALKTVDKLVDELNIIVRDQVGERSYETYSGGERGLANFATRLGLAALTSTRSGARIETMVVDEAFSSLDESVSERMRAFLGTLPDKFPLVLVITHDAGFKGTLGSQIVVSPGQNGSTVEVVG